MIGLSHFDHLTLFQLLQMRKGAEHERWDRLAYQLALQSRFAGNKGKVRMEQFHKFLMTSSSLTKTKLHNLKGLFPKRGDK